MPVKTLSLQYPGIAISFIVLVLFAAVSPYQFLSGDAIFYAEQILDANFSVRTIHIGYYYMGYIFDRISPFDIAYSLNLMSCVFGALAVYFCYNIALHLTSDVRVASFAGIIIAVNTVFVFNAIYAEVYIMSATLVVGAFLIYLHRNFVASGTIAAISFLVSPSSVFMAPVFFIRRPRVRHALLFSIAGIIVLAAGLLPHWDNFLFGPRGLLATAEQPADIVLASAKFIHDVFFGFYAYMPFLMVGFITLIRTPGLRPFAVVVIASWGLVFFLVEKFGDVPVQLPNYYLFAVAAAIGAVRFTAAPRIVRLVAILGTIVFAVGSIAAVELGNFPPQYLDNLPSIDQSILLLVYSVAMTVLLFNPSEKLLYGALAVATILNIGLVTRDVTESSRAMSEFESAVWHVADNISKEAYITGGFADVVRYNWFVHKKSKSEKAIIVRNNVQDFIDKLDTGAEIWFIGNHAIAKILMRQNGIIFETVFACGQYCYRLRLEDHNGNPKDKG